MSASSSSKDRERDRSAFPTPQQVRAQIEDGGMQHMLPLFHDKIAPQLRNADNYRVVNGLATIVIECEGSLNEEALGYLRAVLHREFISKTPGWRISSIDSMAPDEDSGARYYVSIVIEEDRDAAAINAEIEAACATATRPTYPPGTR